jgi:hypothetical protein
VVHACVTAPMHGKFDAFLVPDVPHAVAEHAVSYRHAGHAGALHVSVSAPVHGALLAALLPSVPHTTAEHASYKHASHTGPSQARESAPTHFWSVASWLPLSLHFTGVDLVLGRPPLNVVVKILQSPYRHGGHAG